MFYLFGSLYAPWFQIPPSLRAGGQFGAWCQKEYLRPHPIINPTKQAAQSGKVNSVTPRPCASKKNIYYTKDAMYIYCAYAPNACRVQGNWYSTNLVPGEPRLPRQQVLIGVARVADRHGTEKQGSMSMLQTQCKRDQHVR
jgi:hypothetical protein